MSLVSQLICDGCLDFLFLSETWQLPSIVGKMDVFSSSFFDFAGSEDLSVRLFSKPRPGGRRGGGVALLCRRSLPVENFSVHFPAPSSFEFLSVKFCLDFSFVFVGIYRSPSCNSFSKFMCEFRFLLISLCALTCPSVIAGDFNVKLNLSGDRNTKSFLRLLSEYNFVALFPQSPTHRLGNVLDFLVVSSSLSSVFGSVTSDTSVEGSDHFPVLFNLETGEFNSSPVNTVQLKSFRNFKFLDSVAFKSGLEKKLDPLLLSDSLSFGDYLVSYRRSIVSVLDLLVPVHSKLVSSNSNPPWFDQEYIHQRSIRKRLQNSSNKAAYNAQKRFCAYLCKMKRMDYYSALVADVASTNNQALLYKLLNKLTGRTVGNVDNFPAHDCDSDLANQFNNAFSEKVNMIRQSISPSLLRVSDQSVVLAPPDHSESLPSVLDSFTPTDVEEIMLIIKDNGVKTGPGDVLTPSLIKQHLDVLCPHFVKLVNLSLSSLSCDGIKEAHVVPILKASNLDKNNLKNFRPVSLLSFISKLTERVVHSRINAHLAANSLDNHAQYGYKKNHSCETLLLKLIDDILVAVDQKFGVVVMIIDLSAAFDTVDHSILLNILQFKYRISGSALNWLKSFLSGRTQRVRVGNSLSDSFVVDFGVAQGSVLGPLLFNMYCFSISDVFVSCGFGCMGYADDNIGVRVFPAYASISNFTDVIPNCLRSLKQWANSHFLKLNSSKTQLMIFGNSSLLSSFSFHTIRDFDGSIIPVSKQIKLLGITLDSSLSFDCCVSDIVSSVNLTLRNIRSIRKYLNQAAVETLVHSLITSKLDACNSLFVGFSKKNLCKLQLLQNSALRCVLNIATHSSLSQHFVKLHWLHVEKRIHFKYITVIFKCINNLAPVQLSSKIRLSCAFEMTLSTNLFLPTSSWGKKSFSYMAPRCWNALPIELRLIPTLELFKCHLKTFLFSNFRRYLRNINPYTSVSVSHGGELADDEFLLDYILR